MTGSEGEIVYTRTGSGKVHKRIRTAAGFVPYGGEADNLDDANEEALTAEQFADAEDLCERCFGKPEDDAA